MERRRRSAVGHRKSDKLAAEMSRAFFPLLRHPRVVHVFGFIFSRDCLYFLPMPKVVWLPGFINPDVWSLQPQPVNAW
ncbi:unnamed protein product [Caenorhabditis auriculariae]|uniref:Uncharacterized protein n=1 Tax=Caenorhabditis auriculariae TaxID=2777116 RepID=A0A8S1GN00_9PELO|nr:unnamed protein product [Caenorhabditis auriculariae]